MKINGRNVILFLSVILSIATIVYLIYNLDWETVKFVFAQLRFGWLGLALIIYCLNIVLRAFRFKKLLYSRPVSGWLLISIVGLHNMFNYIMPARTGEFSYILLAKDRLKIPFSEGTATLFAARIYDFVVIALILLVLLPFSYLRMPGWMVLWTIIFCVLVLSSFGVLLLFFVKRPKKASRVRSSNSLIAKIGLAWDKFIFGLQQIYSRRAQLSLGLLTLGIWMCVYTNFYFIILGLGYSVDYFQVVIISLVMVPLNLLPFQGFANLGTHELGWVSVLVLFSYPEDAALAIAVGSHFILFLFVLIWGGLSLVLAQVLSKRVPIRTTVDVNTSSQHNP